MLQIIQKRKLNIDAGEPLVDEGPKQGGKKGGESKDAEDYCHKHFPSLLEASAHLPTAGSCAIVPWANVWHQDALPHCKQKSRDHTKDLRDHYGIVTSGIQAATEEDVDGDDPHDSGVDENMEQEELGAPHRHQGFLLLHRIANKVVPCLPNRAIPCRLNMLVSCHLDSQFHLPVIFTRLQDVLSWHLIVKTVVFVASREEG